MKEIKIDETTYKLPTCYEDITLGDYETWFDFECKTFNDRIQLISLITKIPYELLLDLPTSFFTYLVGEVSFAFSKGFGSFNKKNEITIDGISYSISYRDELTLAEWVDVEAVYKQKENRLSEILAICCRPSGEKYNPKNNPVRIEMFKSLTLDKVFPLFSFFLTLNQKYKEIMNHCSMVVETANQQAEQCATFLKNGDGTIQLSYWQKKIYQKLMKRLKKQLLKYSTSYPT